MQHDFTSYRTMDIGNMKLAYLSPDLLFQLSASGSQAATACGVLFLLRINFLFLLSPHVILDLLKFEGTFRSEASRR